MFTIKTNNVPRPLMHLGDFNENIQSEIRKDYDWMNPQDIEFQLRILCLLWAGLPLAGFYASNGR